jgi:hypothetical protein
MPSLEEELQNSFVDFVLDHATRDRLHSMQLSLLKEILPKRTETDLSDESYGKMISSLDRRGRCASIHFALLDFSKLKLNIVGNLCSRSDFDWIFVGFENGFTISRLLDPFFRDRASFSILDREMCENSILSFASYHRSKN